MAVNFTEIIYILDRSGSMSGLEKDTIDGYNSFLERQKECEGDAIVTTVLFDDRYSIIHDGVDINNVSPLTQRQYYARGMTALLDAIGKTIVHVHERRLFSESGRTPDKTVVVITTDGQENMSSEYSMKKVKNMIERMKTDFGWEFLFLGANIDAVETAEGFGINEDHAVTYHADSKGTALNFDCVTDAVRSVRASGCMAQGWKRGIERHREKKENGER